MEPVRVAYDPEAKAMSIALTPFYRIDGTKEVQDGILLDFEDGKVCGVEVLASHLPDSFPAVAAEYGFIDRLAAIYRAVTMATSMTASDNLRLTMCEAMSR